MGTDKRERRNGGFSDTAVGRGSHDHRAVIPQTRVLQPVSRQELPKPLPLFVHLDSRGDSVLLLQLCHGSSVVARPRVNLVHPNLAWANDPTSRS